MLTDTSASPYARMTSMPAGSCGFSGAGPLAILRERVLRTTIPAMGRIMFDPSISHAYENFLVAAGDRPGHFAGPPFMDGDLYKWLETATVAAAETGDAELLDYIAKAAAAIGRAPRPDGYLHTKTIVARGEPLSERLEFQTYNLGHLMSLACVHHRLTGDEAYLRIATRAAEYLIGVADTSPERLADCNICPSHYMGVVELYRTTKEPKYLRLARRLLDLHGGKGRLGSDDNQDVLPVREQRQAVGHAVRANYLYAGMADYVLETGDPELRTALDSIWDDLVSRKLYVTGGCGALYDGASPDGGQDYWAVTRVHQAYGRPYQLPNTTAYNESCASLGLVMWAWRMLALTGDARYADEIERVLYNALPAMVGADGTSYFYTNPLRQVRGLPYPLRRAGDPKDSVPPPSEQRGRQGVVRVRVPGWADQAAVTVTVDGAAAERVEHGYVVIDREWLDNVVEVEIPLRTRLVAAHRFLEEATGQVCVVRGPVVYCIESADLPAGVGIESVAIPRSIAWTEEPGAGVFRGHLLLRGTAARLPVQAPDALYAELDPAEPTALDVRLVPYGLWGNRGPGEMSVWLRLLH